MSLPTRTPLTASLSRLLLATMLGLLLTTALAATIDALTPAPPTSAVGGLAVLAAAAAFAWASYELAEHLVARRTARAQAAAVEPPEDPGRAEHRLTLYRDIAVLTARDGVAPVLAQFLDEDVDDTTVAAAAVDALLRAEPEVLDGLRQTRAARPLPAARETAGATS